MADAHPSDIDEAEAYYVTCKICNKELRTPQYKRHLQEIHSGKPKRKCPLCYGEFSRKEHVQKHINAFHKLHIDKVDNELKPLFKLEDCKINCEECDQYFISEDILTFHKDKQHGKGHFACKKCKKKFMKKENLKKHETFCKNLATLLANCLF